MAIAAHLLARFGFGSNGPFASWPLYAVLAGGGTWLVGGLLVRLARGEFGSDLLAGASIVTSVLLGEPLAGTLVVLMLSGGQALEAFAVKRASAVLNALAKRVPSVAHRKRGDGLADVPLDEVAPGDLVVVFPHETCPVDGVVAFGHGSMDESYLTGEPYVMAKAPGVAVLSGAVNGEAALTIRAEKRAVDSRYAKIMRVMRDSEQRRPRIRRLGDRLGALYGPLAVAIAIAAWAVSGDPLLFLGVLVVATPCPLLIAIPVAIIGSISLAARRGIIVRDPSVLETLETCRTALFDKTGTLTYGAPALTEVIPAAGFDADAVLAFVASLEAYSRHPLAKAILAAARERGLALRSAEAVSERPGEGLTGVVGGKEIRVTSRSRIPESGAGAEAIPERSAGMECAVLEGGRYAALLRFRDEPRADGLPFVRHLSRRHGIERVILVSGDRESEVRYLAEKVGIDEVHASCSPEEKLDLVRKESAKANTVFVGDGINDAPALTAATVGVAFGQGTDVTAEAAGAVVLDTSLQKVDELFHIGRRMRRIALESAFLGMGLSVVGMSFAAAGALSPVMGAIAQEVIDVLAIANALRAAVAPKAISDY